MSRKKRGVYEQLNNTTTMPARETSSGMFPHKQPTVSGRGVAVFISHSHRDRDFALYLNGILRENGANTFLDQEQLVPGQQLPNELRKGIKECGLFLLLWSQHSSISEWVNKEWNLAWDERKKIVPYVLDGTTLPGGLSNLIYIDSEDMDHGHGALLQAVFGKSFRPHPGAMFPGQWHMESQTGPASASYDFELKVNGQVEGVGRYHTESGQVGDLFNLLNQSGGAANWFVELSRRPFALSGTWSYNDCERVLTLDLRFSVLGQVTGESVRILTSGNETGDLGGADTHGRYYRLRRRADAGGEVEPQDEDTVEDSEPEAETDEDTEAEQDEDAVEDEGLHDALVKGDIAAEHGELGEKAAAFLDQIHTMGIMLPNDISWAMPSVHLLFEIYDELSDSENCEFTLRTIQIRLGRLLRKRGKDVRTANTEDMKSLERIARREGVWEWTEVDIGRRRFSPLFQQYASAAKERDEEKMDAALDAIRHRLTDVFWARGKDPGLIGLEVVKSLELKVRREGLY